MRYSQLRAFHHVAMHGGFSRAARVLNISQPSVSDQVRQLEQGYDVLLFHREARQVRMTDAGEALFRLTSEMFEVEDRIAALLDESRTTLKGHLRVVADSAMHITDAVRRFREANPNVFISIQTGNTETLLRRLRNYEAEIGVVANTISAPDLDSVDLGRTPILGLVAKNYLPKGTHALRFADLSQFPLIYRETGSRTRAQVEEHAARLKLDLSPSIEVEGREAMREVVASGAGVGFVSEAEVGHDRRLRAVPFEDVDLGMSESLVTLSTRRDVPLIRGFLRAVKKSLSATKA
ncbi:LysR substrate-binding domain-containing protein [Marivita hallyeonensis]|uniref:Aminoethylphosphonate catabolism associated LysR family transcriptional regulator n=1 Tax=Marivita hallyeonensis TaxID=996342 RepID=A0A1M5U261_9RHOB|nr:LysR substrate-binding domain-containing protein [Marivita hallyeonensis]SHH57044.1 aminoethylphosphonate catabolism associated LysR family transcriptional regulator [Marivita hallyeonensis]